MEFLNFDDFVNEGRTPKLNIEPVIGNKIKKTQKLEMIAKVVKIDSYSITFSNGLVLSALHDMKQEIEHCDCETHYLGFGDLDLDDFKNLEFDLSGDTFFNRIRNYGIELIPIRGHSVKVAGYGCIDAWYTDGLVLVLSGGNFVKKFDITECIEGGLW